jgi:hypothetical protein
MAQKEDGPLGKLGGNGFVWIVLAMFGTAALNQAPLLVQHPAAKEASVSPVGAAPVADARLWQDPFAVIRGRHGQPARGVGALETATPEVLKPLAETLGNYRKRDPQRPALTLIVTASDAPYAEHAEQRRRTRVAVVEALLSEGFVAEDAQHLHLAGKVPYEWFVRPDALEGQPPDGGWQGTLTPQLPASVLVLWIAESSLLPRPRAALCPLLAELSGQGAPPIRPSSSDTAGCKAAPAGFVVLGPNDSTTLEAVVNEALGRTGRPELPCTGTEATALTRPLLPHFYTSTATLTLECLHTASAESRDTALTHSANAGLADLGITRTIATDEQLAGVLAAELANRGVNPYSPDEHPLFSDQAVAGSIQATLRRWIWPDWPCPDDVVAVITEADTPYGRGMPSAFFEQLGGKFEQLGDTFQPGNKHAHSKAKFKLVDSAGNACFETGPRSPIVFLKYLRGLNGETAPLATATEAADSPGRTDGGAGAALAAAGEGRAAAGGDSGDAAAQTQRAEGNAQIDYLGRIADQLQALDARLRADPLHPRALRAVGLLGTDVYDKLMLLRALKPRLPAALFFSTDLDARLLDDSELRWTRNLVVVTGFGLRVFNGAQGHMPAFRDTYQTSTYLATRVAVRAPAGDVTLAEQTCVDAWTSQVRLFEIGRQGQNELVPPEPLLIETTGASPRSVHTLPRLRPQVPSSECPPGALTQANAAESSQDAPTPLVRWNNPQPKPEQRLVAGRLFSDLQRTWLCIAIAVLTMSALLRSRSARHRRTEAAGASPAAAPAATVPRAVVAFGLPLLSAIAVGFAAAQWLLPWVQHWMGPEELGQPMLLFSGISAWPPLAMVTVATVRWTWIVLRTNHRLNHNLEEVHLELGFPGTFEQLKAEIIRQDRRESLWVRVIRDLVPNSLLPPPAAARPAAGPTDAAACPLFWSRYVRYGLRSALLGHRLVLLLVMFAVVIWVWRQDPIGNNLPLRGAYFRAVYPWVNHFALVTQLALMWVVLHASLFCCDFVRHLPAAADEWPRASFARLSSERGIGGGLAVPWLQLQLTALRTKVITPLIYEPYLFLAVLIFSHSALFSAWQASLLHLVILAGIALATAVFGFQLRRSAEAVRADSIARFEAELHRLHGQDAAHAARRELVARLIDSAQTLREGAFAPFSEQPLIRSLLLPLLSIGGTAALDLVPLLLH